MTEPWLLGEGRSAFNVETGSWEWIINGANKIQQKDIATNLVIGSVGFDGDQHSASKSGLFCAVP
jgi:hypothetical protein